MADLTKLSHSSLHNYQQATINDSDTFSGSLPVAHNLGYVPYVRVWNEQISGEVSLPVVVSAATTYHDDFATAAQLDSMSISSTQLSMTTSASLLVYWRIYIDAAR